MKKIGIINSELASLISKLGHTDSIIIADCGLPIPAGVKRIDLALKKGMPSFMDTLETILVEMEVEAYTLAEEMRESNPQVFAQTTRLLKGIAANHVTHAQFKSLASQTRAVIRTGECSPFANILLQAGVIF